VKLLASTIGVATSAVRVFGIASKLAFGGPLGIVIAAAVAAITFFGVTLLRDVNWTQFAQTALNAWKAIEGFVRTAAQVVVSTWTGVKQFFSDLWTGITTAAEFTWNGIKSFAEGAFQFIVQLWSTLAQTFDSAWQSIRSVFDAGWEAIKQGARAAWEFIRSTFIEPVIAGLNSLIEIAKKAASALGLAKSSGSEAASAQSLARGGAVRGPGTGTSDSIPAWLSDGEFVMRSKAVKKYGLGFMHAINRANSPLERLVRGFANGGLVSALSSAMPKAGRYGFAHGGPARSSSGRPITLVLDGQSFNMSAEQDVAESLVRYSTTRRVRSAGRKPAYVGAV
jgi:hypothetical protein